MGAPHKYNVFVGGVCVFSGLYKSALNVYSAFIAYKEASSSDFSVVLALNI